MSARRADALVDLAIAGNAASGKQGSTPRHLAYLHVSDSALNGGDGRCDIHGHGDSLDEPVGISIDTALRMLCDADIDSWFLTKIEAASVSAIGRTLFEACYAAKSNSATSTAARFPAAPVGDTSRSTTSNTERTTAPTSCPTSRCCADSTTTVSTKVAGLPCAHPTASSSTDLTPADGRCKWGGERLDLGYALDALFSRTHTPQGVPKR